MLITFKKYLSYSLVLLALILSQSNMVIAQDRADSGGVLDDSIKDISIVLGAGAAGAVLGLSTLSFVEEPSEHLKNIAVGGAIGIVVGVGVVMFSQATRANFDERAQVPLNANKVETLARYEFSSQKIAESYLKTPNIGYSFSF